MIIVKVKIRIFDGAERCHCVKREMFPVDSYSEVEGYIDELVTDLLQSVGKHERTLTAKVDVKTEYAGEA